MIGDLVIIPNKVIFISIYGITKVSLSAITVSFAGYEPEANYQ